MLAWMSKCKTVAAMGGEGSFSHECALATFPKSDIRVHYQNFEEVIEAVQHHEADCGLVPLHNANHRYIERAHCSIFEATPYVGVTNLLEWHVRLFCYSYYELSQVIEARTYGPVLAQSAAWREQNLPSAQVNDNFSSTADAIRSLDNDRDFPACAIGSSYFKAGQSVPCIGEDIQTEPNYTIFGVVGELETVSTERVLMGIRDFSETKFWKLQSYLGKLNCKIDSNWEIQGQDGAAVLACEVVSTAGQLLPAAMYGLTGVLKGVFVWGGYNNVSFASILSRRFKYYGNH
jgi:prephenate dehydratase